MSAPRSPWLALVVLLAMLVVASFPAGPSSEAAQATPPVPRGGGPAGRSPTLLGDINNDGVVDILDYGIWRQQFGTTGCGNAADLNGDCVVDILDYGIWRQQFGQTGPTLTPTANTTPTATPTATPALTGRAYVANSGSNN